MQPGSDVRRFSLFRSPLIRAVALVMAATVALSGCGGSGSSGSSGSATQTLGVLHGSVHGGRQAIVGSTVLIYEAGATAGAAPTQIAATTTLSDGTFNVTTFSPTPANGQLVYLVAIGGDAGGGFNSAANLMTVAGVWGSASFPNTVNTNELSTVASASQLQNYLVEVPCANISGTTVSTGECPSIAGATGLISQANTIGNLINVTSGAATPFLTSAAAGSAINTTYLKLNTEASIIAGCINSGGGVSGDGSACGNLFGLTTPAADTLYASWQLAVSPTANAAGTAVLDLLSPPTVYAPTLASAPASWTTAGQKYTLVPNATGNTISVYSISTTGYATQVAGSPFASGASTLAGLTTDPTGRFAYALDSVSNTVRFFTIDPSTGTLAANGSTATGNGPSAIAMDPVGGYAYITNSTDATVAAYTVNADGTLTAAGSTVATTGTAPNALTIDPTGAYAYVLSSSGTTASKLDEYTLNSSTGALTSIGTAVSISNGSPKAVIVSPNDLNVYVASTGTAISRVSEYRITAGTGALTVFATVTLLTADKDIRSLTIDATSTHLYAASNTGGKVLPYNISGGTLTLGTSIQTLVGATGVVLDPNGSFLYAVSQSGATLTSYVVNGGVLSPNNGSVATGGDPLSITLNATGNYAYVANYTDNTISAYTVAANGALTADGAALGTVVGPEQVVLDPAGTYAYVAGGTSTGGVGSLESFLVNANGTVTGNGVVATTSTGGDLYNGMTIDPTGKYAYVLPDDGNSDVLQYLINADGTFTGNGSTNANIDNPFTVSVDPSGRYAYIANFGNNTISAYLINSDGTLTANGSAGTSSAPEHLAVAPSGQYLYAVDASATLSAFIINADGSLTANGSATTGSAAAGLAIDPTSHYVYVACNGTVSAYIINVDGTLTTNGTTVISGTGKGVAINPAGTALYAVTSSAEVIPFGILGNGTLGPLLPYVVPTGTEPLSVTMTP